MIDKIKLIIKYGSQNIQYLVMFNKLDSHVVNNKLVRYDNKQTKNFSGGMRILFDEISKNIVIVGSLHKFYNYTQTKKTENYTNNLNIKQIQEAFYLLHLHTQIDLFDAQVKFYEVGINLYVANDPETYLTKLTHLVSRKKVYRLLENPKYKEFKVYSSNMNNDKRKHYKAYCKNTELKKEAKLEIDYYVLRLETVFTRPEKVYFSDFVSTVYLKELFKEFETDWLNVEYNNYKFTMPKGLHIGKASVLKNILLFGIDKTLEHIETSYKNNEITKKQKRTQKEFVNKEYLEKYSNFKLEEPSEKKEIETNLKIEIFKALNIN